MKIFRFPARRHYGGFTLAELMVAMCIGSVVCAITMAGMVFLQKSYAATEQYALSMTDQMRVLDYLAMDLRRATAAVDLGTANQLTITLPAYYSYDPADTTHQAPVPALATIPSSSARAVYSGGSTTPAVQYRFDPASNQLLRQETLSDGTKTAWITVASQLVGFPDITPCTTTSPWYAISVKFAPTFQTLNTPSSNVITLKAAVYPRNS